MRSSRRRPSAFASFPSAIRRARRRDMIRKAKAVWRGTGRDGSGGLSTDVTLGPIFAGRDEIEAFLTRKWERELEYRLIKELWAHDGNRIAVRFAYEWHDADGRWFRSYGNENWEFAANGLMQQRIASINDLPIEEGDRLFHWSQGRRPDDHPGLSDLGL